MPVINGMFYLNPQIGLAQEAARAAEGARFAEAAREAKSSRGLSDEHSAPSNESWLDRQIDRFKPQPAPPPPPKPPGLPPQVYDDMKIRDLRVRQVANIVANENHDVTPIPGKTTEDDLQKARVLQAHAIMNADERWGPKRDTPGHAPTADDKVSASLEHLPQYQKALDAARTAFVERSYGHDPTGGRMYFNNRTEGHPKDPAGEWKLGDERVAVFGQPHGPFQLGDQKKYTNIYDNPKHLGKPTP